MRDMLSVPYLSISLDILSIPVALSLFSFLIAFFTSSWVISVFRLCRYPCNGVMSLNSSFLNVEIILIEDLSGDKLYKKFYLHNVPQTKIQTQYSLKKHKPPPGIEPGSLIYMMSTFTTRPRWLRVLKMQETEYITGEAECFQTQRHYVCSIWETLKQVFLRRPE